MAAGAGRVGRVSRAPEQDFPDHDSAGRDRSCRCAKTWRRRAHRAAGAAGRGRARAAHRVRERREPAARRARARAARSRCAARSAPSRGRIVRQLLTESLLLALAGGVWACSRARRCASGSPSSATGCPARCRCSRWPRVLLHGPRVAGHRASRRPCLPALRRGALESHLRDQGAEAARGGRGARGRACAARWWWGRWRSRRAAHRRGAADALAVAAEHRESRVRSRGVLTWSVSLAERRYPEREQMVRFFDELVEPRARPPAVRIVGASKNLPLGDGGKPAHHRLSGGRTGRRRSSRYVRGTPSLRSATFTRWAPPSAGPWLQDRRRRERARCGDREPGVGAAAPDGQRTPSGSG